MDGKELKELQTSNAKDFVKFVNLELNDIRKSFIKIGFRLKEALSLDYRVYLGYKSFEELCESEFGFKKSTAYNFIKVWEYFYDNNNKMCIDSKYQDFDFSKLLEITKCKDKYKNKFLDIIKPTDTVLNIRKFISIVNEYYHKKNLSSSVFGKTVVETIENYNNLVIDKPLTLVEVKEEVNKTEDVTEENFQTSGKLNEELSIYLKSKLDKLLGSYKLVYDPLNSLNELPNGCLLTLKEDIIKVVCGKKGYLSDFFNGKGVK